MYYFHKYLTFIRKNLYLCKYNSGLIGFDSGLECCVSMQSAVCRLYNLGTQIFIWRKQLRSRCLTEVQ